MSYVCVMLIGTVMFWAKLSTSPDSAAELGAATKTAALCYEQALALRRQLCGWNRLRTCDTRSCDKRQTPGCSEISLKSWPLDSPAAGCLALAPPVAGGRIVYLMRLFSMSGLLLFGGGSMHEGLQLFEEVVQNPIFENTPIFVFLNKKDLFEQMMTEGIPLSRCFPDYRVSQQSVVIGRRS